MWAGKGPARGRALPDALGGPHRAKCSGLGRRVALSQAVTGLLFWTGLCCLSLGGRLLCAVWTGGRPTAPGLPVSRSFADLAGHRLNLSSQSGASAGCLCV